MRVLGIGVLAVLGFGEYRRMLRVQGLGVTGLGFRGLGFRA